MAFLWKCVYWLFGYAVLQIRGGDGERFLSLCRKAEVELWGIRRVSPGVLEVRVYLFALPQIPPLALRCGAEVLEKGRYGLLPLLKRYRLRPGLFAGAALYLCLIVFLSRFVWSVQIPGADPLRQAKIREALLDAGFGVGSFIPSVDYRALKYDLMLSSEGEIAFVSVNQTGCRAVVEVRFSSPAPERIDDKTPCNLVASRDGQIVSVLVRTGMRYVQPGQAVREGDLLVGGIYDTRLGYYVVHAKGTVLARVNETVSETVPLEETVYERTGKRKIRRTLNVYGRTRDLSPRFVCPYSAYETETTVKHLSFGDTAVPVTLTETAYYETAPLTAVRSPEEAEALARTLVNEKERLRDSGAWIESVRETVRATDRSVTLIREYTVITDICKEKEFYFEDDGEHRGRNFET